MAVTEAGAAGAIAADGAGIGEADKGAKAQTAPHYASAAEAERAAVKIAMAHAGGVAWQTILFLALCYLSFGAVVWAVLTGVMPLWGGLIANSIIAYYSIAPLHEATHGNVVGRRKDLRWLNAAVGYLAGFLNLASYDGFRTLHLIHHKHLLEPDKDPDYDMYAKPNKWIAPIAGLTAYIHLYKALKKATKDTPNARVAWTRALQWAIVATVTAVGFMFGYGIEVLMLWVLPGVIGIAIVVYTLAWIPHHQHVPMEARTRVELPKLSAPVQFAYNLAMAGQSYHHLHHAFPQIPFFRYQEAYREMKPALDAADPKIWRAWPEEKKAAGTDGTA